MKSSLSRSVLFFDLRGGIDAPEGARGVEPTTDTEEESGCGMVGTPGFATVNVGEIGV